MLCLVPDTEQLKIIAIRAAIVCPLSSLEGEECKEYKRVVGPTSMVGSLYKFRKVAETIKTSHSMLLNKVPRTAAMPAI